MRQLNIISYKQLENASTIDDKLTAIMMNNNNLKGILQNHLCNIVDRELAQKLILGYIIQPDNIAVTSDIKTVLDVFVNASVRLKNSHIDIYDLAVKGSSVTSMVFIFIQDDILPVGLFVSRYSRREYVYAPVLLNSAKNIHNILLEDSKLA